MSVVSAVRDLLIEELERGIRGLDGVPRGGWGLGVIPVFVGKEGVELDVLGSL